MDERITEIRKHLKKKLNPMRYEHTLGVSYTCMALAMRYSAIWIRRRWLDFSTTVQSAMMMRLSSANARSMALN